ncbi:hypothetical protein JCM10296v2_003201 [Rhodotorula toruloides]
MQNSDKFQQDEGIVPDNDPSVTTHLEGVLDGPDEPFTEDKGVNAPTGENYESVKDNQIGDGEFENDEYDGVREDNIVDGDRPRRGTQNYAQADEQADKLVEQVSDNMNDGRSRVAY